MYCPACSAAISRDQKYGRACGMQVKTIAQIVKQQEDLDVLEMKQKDYFEALGKYLVSSSGGPSRGLSRGGVISQVVFWLVIIVGAIVLFELFRK